MAKKTSKAKKTVVKTDKVEQKSVVSTQTPQQMYVSKREAAIQRTFRKLRKFGKYIQVEPVMVRDIKDPIRCEICQRVLLPGRDKIGSIQFPDNEKYIVHSTICRKCLLSAQISSVSIEDLNKLAITEYPSTIEDRKLVQKLAGQMMPCDVCYRECGTNCFVYWNNKHRIPIKIHYCPECFESLKAKSQEVKVPENIGPNDIKESAEDLLNDLKEA